MAALTIKTDEALLAKLSRSAREELGGDEARKQRVSFIYAGLPRESGVTKYEIEKHLNSK